MGKMKEGEPIGYSKDFTPNINYKEEGLLCEWEHCIEHMPLIREDNYHNPDEIEEIISVCCCPVFGHICPGGVEKVAECDKSIFDIRAYRFAKNIRSEIF